MEQKKSIGFGFRGWMLFIYQFFAFIAYGCFCNWPMNVFGSSISALLGQGESFIASINAIMMVLGIILQLVFSRGIGKVKSVKKLASIMGIVTIIFAAGVCFISPFENPVFWTICYALECLVCVIWATFLIGIIIGQWFPRRKGTFMGLVTIAFPIGNSFMSYWIQACTGGANGISFARGFWPYFTVILIALIIGITLVPDFPEQCGAYRDNDKNMTPEIAQKMTEFEMENRKTTVWTIKETLAFPGFWLITVPMGFILMCSVGVMTQSAGIIGTYFSLGSSSFTWVMYGICGAAVIGSWVLGVLDTKFGTKKAMIIATIFMIISGIVGMFKSPVALVVALVLLGVFMGAGSNFTVSGSVQYWRIEDFPSVFARVNPIANLFQAVSAYVFAILLNSLMGYQAVFIFCGIAGIISLICLLIFKPSMVKERDDKLRAAAGKPLDDVLVGRK